MMLQYLSRRGQRLDSPGFTLIEVVLVLAIAGLLLVVVFAAVSGAESSRRDTQRRRDFARIPGAFDSFAANNHGDYPDDANNGEVDTPTSEFRQDYVLGMHLNDPYDNNGSYHQYIFEDTYTNGPVDGTGMTICSNPAQVGTVYYKLTGRSYLLRMCLEHGDINYSS